MFMHLWLEQLFKVDGMVSSDKRCVAVCGESIQLVLIHNNTPQLASGRVETFSTIYLRAQLATASKLR